LTEPPAGDFSLSPEELEAQAAELGERGGDAVTRYRTKAKANDLEAYRAKAIENRQNFVKKTLRLSKRSTSDAERRPKGKEALLCYL
jgi:hypothetical protein